MHPHILQVAVEVVEYWHEVSLTIALKKDGLEAQLPGVDCAVHGNLSGTSAYPTPMSASPASSASQHRALAGLRDSLKTTVL